MSKHKEILHVGVYGIYFFNNKQLAATLRRLANEAESGGINPSQPADIAVMRENPGGGGPCGTNQISVDVSLVPPVKFLPTVKERRG